MNSRERQALDLHITGHGGEDSVGPEPDGRGVFPKIRKAIDELLGSIKRDDRDRPSELDHKDAKEDAILEAVRGQDATLSDLEAKWSEDETKAWEECVDDLREMVQAAQFAACPICDGRSTNRNDPGTVHCTYCNDDGIVARWRREVYAPEER